MIINLNQEKTLTSTAYFISKTERLVRIYTVKQTDLAICAQLNMLIIYTIYVVYRIADFSQCVTNFVANLNRGVLSDSCRNQNWNRLKNVVAVMNSDIIGLTFETEIVSVLGVTELNFIGFVIRNKARG